MSSANRTVCPDKGKLQRNPGQDRVPHEEDVGNEASGKSEYPYHVSKHKFGLIWNLVKIQPFPLASHISPGSQACSFGDWGPIRQAMLHESEIY